MTLEEKILHASNTAHGKQFCFMEEYGDQDGKYEDMHADPFLNIYRKIFMCGVEFGTLQLFMTPAARALLNMQQLSVTCVRKNLQQFCLDVLPNHHLFQLQLLVFRSLRSFFPHLSCMKCLAPRCFLNIFPKFPKIFARRTPKCPLRLTLTVAERNALSTPPHITKRNALKFSSSKKQ